MIFGPDGRPLVEPLPENEEGILYADIDLGMIAIAKSAADPVGHYSRPDVTRLLLNTDPNPVVEYFHRPMYEAKQHQPGPERKETKHLFPTMPWNSSGSKASQFWWSANLGGLFKMMCHADQFILLPGSCDNL